MADLDNYDFDDIEELQRNPTLEAEGVEVEIPAAADGTPRFLHLRAATDANPQWRANAEKMLNEVNRLRNARASAERIREFQARNYSRFLIKDWKGVKVKGNEIPYSPDAGFAFLMKAYDIFTIVEGYVTDTRNFRAERNRVVVGEVKN